MCFDGLMETIRRSNRQSNNQGHEEEEVEQQKQLVDLQPVGPPEVLVSELLLSLRGQAVLQCRTTSNKDTMKSRLYFMVTIPGQMRSRLMAMRTEKTTGGEDMETMATAIASRSRSMTPSVAPLRCSIVVWSDDIPVNVDGKSMDIEKFVEDFVEPPETFSAPRRHDAAGNLVHVEVEKVLATTKDSDTVASVWEGPMQIHLRWHGKSIVIGNVFKLTDFGLVHIVGGATTPGQDPSQGGIFPSGPRYWGSVHTTD